MNPVFIAFCLATLLIMVLIVFALIGFKYIHDEEYITFLSGFLVCCITLFLILIPVTACAWKSSEEQYRDCMYKVENTQYCTDKYLIKE